MHEGTMRESWDIQIAAEDKFREAQVAVARVAPRDNHDLVMKGAASVAYDDVSLAGHFKVAVIGYAVAKALVMTSVTDRTGESSVWRR
jgi:hypothetical protein